MYESDSNKLNNVLAYSRFVWEAEMDHESGQSKIVRLDRLLRTIYNFHYPDPLNPVPNGDGHYMCNFCSGLSYRLYDNFPHEDNCAWDELEELYG